jgi:galactitol PTS system EIIA component
MNIDQEKPLLVLNESLVAIDLEAQDANIVIRALAVRLQKQGLVSDTYGEDTIAREQNHPTGLPTTPFCIAFPHAGVNGVLRSALAIAILKDPVIFKNMADPEEDLSVELVIMLANNNPDEQIQVLRSLALLFGQPEKLMELRNQATPETAVAWLRQELSLKQDSEVLQNPEGGASEPI